LGLEKNGTPNFCPLCGENNSCGNLSANNQGEDCWCVDSAISFPDSLLSQVSDADKNKACICKTCALRHKLHGEELAINVGSEVKNNKLVKRIKKDS
jgi:hypothetical protein